MVFGYLGFRPLGVFPRVFFTQDFCPYPELRMCKTRDLSVFERGEIIGARRIGHSISEVMQALGFSRITVSRMYREYIHSDKTIPARVNCHGQQCVNMCGHRRLAGIVTADRRTIV